MVVLIVWNQVSWWYAAAFLLVPVLIGAAADGERAPDRRDRLSPLPQPRPDDARRLEPGRAVLVPAADRALAHLGDPAGDCGPASRMGLDPARRRLPRGARRRTGAGAASALSRWFDSAPTLLELSTVGVTVATSSGRPTPNGADDERSRLAARWVPGRVARGARRGKGAFDPRPAAAIPAPAQPWPVLPPHGKTGLRDTPTRPPHSGTSTSPGSASAPRPSSPRARMLGAPDDGAHGGAHDE